MSKNRQQQWVARQPGGKFGAPMENTSAPAAPPAQPEPPVAFAPSQVEEPPDDAEYMGDVPENLTAPPRLLRHDRLTKDGQTYIVTDVNQERVVLLGPKGPVTVPMEKMGAYKR